MEKKKMLWKTKGMNRDLSISAFTPEFAFENMNLRLATNESNTMLSWVNERGTLQLVTTEDANITLDGAALGTAVLNDQLIVFTHGSSYDHIYKLVYADSAKTQMSVTELFKGHLGFDVRYPLETLISYEAEDIQKVYWTDGLNQPRMINIMNATIDASKEDIYTHFDFVPAINYEEDFSFNVEKTASSNGLFAPGVIQYCFTYAHKNSQQSNIVEVSPLYYIAHSHRGASPEEKVNNSFKITINHPDSSFKYVRLYSIQRTSLNLEPLVKLLDVIPITDSETAVVYVDNGTTGSTVDPTELLFIGGREIAAFTMAEKDGTLFLGNLTQKHTDVSALQDYFNDHDHRTAIQNAINYNNTDKSISQDLNYGTYRYHSLLEGNSQEITTFKGGETYRFGFQLQKKTGEWTEPIFLADKENTVYPNTGDVTASSVGLVNASLSLNLEDIDFDFSEYIRIRPLVVHPGMGDKSVVCQGVLNPTVFNVEDRLSNSPFSQASWYFRPYVLNQEEIIGPSEADETISSEDITTESLGLSDLGEYSQVDPGFEGFTTTVYALFAYVTDTMIKRILDKRLITTVVKKPVDNPTGRSTAGKSNTSYGVLGIITLTDAEERTRKDGKQVIARRYLFLCKDMWPRPIGDQTADSYLMYQYQDTEFLEPSTSMQKFNICTSMEYTPYLVYRKPYDLADPDDSSLDKFVLKVYDDSLRGYKITIKATEEDVIQTNNVSGRNVQFKHFSTLTESNLNHAVAKDRSLSLGAEIQNTASLIDNPFGKLPNNLSSNNQFFVDQSIVTLNSPDIEFDTDVQTFAMDGLKLRVIGAIPITASISSHKITAGAMLPTDYNSTPTDSITTQVFGTGEKAYNVKHAGVDIRGSQRLIDAVLWNDVSVIKNADDEDGITYTTSKAASNWRIYPWHSTGPLNNDPRGVADDASSVLKTKIEASLFYSQNTKYLSPITYDVNSQMVLTENAEVMNVRIPRVLDALDDINYFANIDKLLYNSDPTEHATYEGSSPYGGGQVRDGILTTNRPVSMKYKSMSHAVIGIKGSGSTVPLLPYVEDGNENIGYYNTGGNVYWNNARAIFSNGAYHKTVEDIYGSGDKFNFLWLGELYRDNVVNRFGGDTKEAVRNNKWVIGGPSKPLGTDEVMLKWDEGDTFYQRYDCLKTYPFTENDENQLVEILSFMCETHVNIDGRYDRNRGQVDNTMMSPKNFNLLNPVYSQENNFFTYQQINNPSDGSDEEIEKRYPNQVYYTKTKESGADVDAWTNVTLASILELDGSKGVLQRLTRLNDQLLAFQDRGISQILYNENYQISTTAGVPIEIANSGKVTGKRYLSNTVGCSNKWSMVTTPIGIYFMDSYNKDIYLFNGQLDNLSTRLGFNSWSKQHIPGMDVKWYPIEGYPSFVTYYDPMNQDVLFVNNATALAYSEKFGAFTSFYGYGGATYFDSVSDTGVWMKPIGYDVGGTPPHREYVTQIWKHRAGDYCNMFGVNRPYWMTLVGNPEPMLDKTFTNLEFRAGVDGEGAVDNAQYIPYLPFDSIEVWNEHQHGVAELSYKNGSGMMQHHLSDGSAHLNRKFRMWRCDIPRDNVPVPNELGGNYSTDAELGITRFRSYPLNRMRNPWMYLKLLKNTGVSGETDVEITYSSIGSTVGSRDRYMFNAEVLEEVISLRAECGVQSGIDAMIYNSDASGMPVDLSSIISITLPHVFTATELSILRGWNPEWLAVTTEAGMIDGMRMTMAKTITEGVYTDHRVEVHDLVMTYFR